MPEYVVLDKDTIKSEIMSYLSIAKKKNASALKYIIRWQNKFIIFTP